MLTVILYSSCISYSHLFETEDYSASIKHFDDYYIYAGTYSYDISTINQEKQMNNLSYFRLNNFIKNKFGEKSTFANVEWDVKTTNFLNFKSSVMCFVTFDLYLPKK